MYNDKNKASNKKQLERILALNQLLNIAEYYNKSRISAIVPYKIVYDKYEHIYKIFPISSTHYTSSIEVWFTDDRDAQAVIDNPNFREILDTIYKN